MRSRLLYLLMLLWISSYYINPLRWAEATPTVMKEEEEEEEEEDLHHICNLITPPQSLPRHFLCVGCMRVWYCKMILLLRQSLKASLLHQLLTMLLRQVSHCLLFFMYSNSPGHHCHPLLVHLLHRHSLPVN